MNDREMLELAAKAAGVEKISGGYINEEWMPINWKPLEDCSDAFRLIVRLGLTVEFSDGYVIIETKDGSVNFELGNNPFAATRRAIVRAAADIGREMK